ncbi:MAG: ribosome biogenesis GTPase [Planctomycetota bacterium]|jgi:ribosome biogenesis GTPase
MMELRKALVVRVDAKVCHVEFDGQVIHAAPRGTLFEDLKGVKNPVAVGDWVMIDDRTRPASLVQVLPRRNSLSRVASSHDPREQVLVANADQVLIISSIVKPKFSSNRTDRILAACQWNDIKGILVLNKIDMDKRGLLADLRSTYDNVGVPVIETCASDGRGLDEVEDILKDKVTVLYGPSGAGKSTMLNTIQPGLNLKVGKISSHWDQGRHTTTFSRLLHLDLGGWVVDTPGIRVFRLHGVKKAEIRGLFPEFTRIQSKCKYPNCVHDHEPECAVLDAVEDGEIPQSRYLSYLEMLIEAAPDEFGIGDDDEEFEEEEQE